MPSPIAHGSLAFLAWPALRGHDPAALPLWRRAALLVLLVGALGAPDLDILIDPLLGNRWFANHGGPTHSLAAGVAFAFLFTAAARILVPAPLLRLWLVGLLAYWSHIVLDACTFGRGVMMLWPFTGERFATPIPLFVGVRHSDWGDWPGHLITLSTESAFAVLVWLIAARTRRRVVRSAPQGPNPAPSHTSLQGALR